MSDTQVYKNILYCYKYWITIKYCISIFVVALAILKIEFWDLTFISKVRFIPPDVLQD